ncbi:MAG: VPDSG-CTERM sorting domain-containing protein [Opitutus sp.]
MKSSVQGGEQANIYGDTSAGSFASGALLSTLTGGAVQQSASLVLSSRYFNVTGGGSSGADPILESVTVNSPSKVPDGGATAVLLGASFLALAALGRRKA